jgi:hypothetical protein
VTACPDVSVQAHGCRRTEACFTCCQLLKGDVLPAGTSCWYVTYQSTAGSAPMLFLVRALGISWNRVVWRLALMLGFALGPRRSGLLSCCVCGQPVRSPPCLQKQRAASLRKVAASWQAAALDRSTPFCCTCTSSASAKCSLKAPNCAAYHTQRIAASS